MTAGDPSASPRAPRSSRRRGIRRLAILFAVAMALPSASAFGDDDLQFWPTFTVYSPTVNGWRGSAEVHARWTDDLSIYNRTVYRLNGGRLFGHGLELFGGYEHTDPGTSSVHEEDRFWEQVEHTARRGTWSLANRVRLENRFVDGAGGVAYRLRYRFRVHHPVCRGRWLLGVGEEAWVHLNTQEPVGTRGFDQNRVTVTAARSVNRHLSIEPGYLHIYENRPSPTPNKVSHVLTLQVTTRF